MNAIKVGVNRQIALPKNVCDQLNITSGDYLEIRISDNHLILTPKILIDKRTSRTSREIKHSKSTKSS